MCGLDSVATTALSSRAATWVQYNATGLGSELTGQVTPIPSPALRRPGRARSGRASGIANGLPAHDLPVAGRELHATRGAREGATGGGHRSSGVIPGAAPHAGSLKRTCRDRHPDAHHHPATLGRAGPAPRRRTCSGSTRRSSGKAPATAPAVAPSPCTDVLRG